MRYLVLLICLIFFVASCNKIKTHRIPGTYSGTLEYSSKNYLYDEDGPYEEVYKNWTQIKDEEIVVEEGFAFIKGIEGYQIPLADFNNSGEAKYVFTGIYTSTIAMSRETLSYRFYSGFYPGSTEYYVWSEYEFIGTRVD
jgi:hypothetical protein